MSRLLITTIFFPRAESGGPLSAGGRSSYRQEAGAGRDNRQLTVFTGPSQASWDPVGTPPQHQQQGWAQHRPRGTNAQQQQQQQQGEAPQQQGASIRGGGTATTVAEAAAATALVGTETAVKRGHTTAAAASMGSTNGAGGDTLERRGKEPATAATAAKHAETATPVKLADQQRQQSSIQQQQ